MQKTNPTHFSPQDILGVNGEYKLLHRVPNRQKCWWTRGPRGECYLYVYELPQLSQLSVSGQQRERRSIIRELDRWRRVLVARPPSFDLFWEGDILCWVEGKVEGAPLSSLAEPLSLYQGISLTEECLCALELIHAERDFQSGDPLLHLNLCPDHIWRSRNGGLLFLHPVSPTMIELSKSDRMSDAEALSGERPPELLRGRYGMSSDIYSVGMSILSAMTGLEISRVDERLQSDRLFTHDLPCPPEVATFLTQLTAFRASARYQSAREALIALQALPPLEPLEAKYPTGSIQSTSPSFAPESTAQIMHQEERQSPLDKHSAEVNDSPENRSLAIVEQQSTEEKSAQLSSSDEFYTLANTKALGSIAAEQLGASPSSSISDRDEVIVGVVIEGELFKRYRLWVALLLLASFFWIGGYLFLAKDTEQRSPLHSNSSTVAPIDRDSLAQDISAKGGLLKEDSLINSQRVNPSDIQPKRALLEPEIKSSPSPQWIKLSGGPIVIGSLPDEGYESEHPQHHAQVTPFEISKTEVTVLQYAQCVAQGVCSTDGLKSSDWGDDRLCNWDRVGRADHPLNCVSWHQARTFALWVGGRLPSEVEWSFAAQGGAGIRLIYPWGDQPASCKYAILSDFVRGAGCGHERTSPVCQRTLGSSKQGVCDLVGNVWEWVMDEWHPNYEGAPITSEAWVHRDGLTWDAQDRVYRGGGAFDELDLPRIARRGHRSPGARLFNLGFRVARDIHKRESIRANDQPLSEPPSSESSPSKSKLQPLRGERPDLSP